MRQFDCLNSVFALKNERTPSNLPLLIRFIKLQESTNASELRLNIARYTNKQSPVVPPDFRSNEKEQEAIAHLFSMLNPPVFYARKRRQWNVLTRQEKKQYSDNVTMVDIAQRWYAFRVSPASAVTQKNELFNQEGNYKIIFVPPRPASEYYAAYLLFKQFNDYLREKKKQAENQKASQQALEDDELLFLELSRANNLVTAHLCNLVGGLILQKYKKFDSATSQIILEKVISGDVVSNLEPLLLVVLTTFADSLSEEQLLSREWRNNETIEKLRKILSQQVAVFKKVNIDVLALV